MSRARNIINGTWGQLYFNGKEISYTKGLEAKLEVTRTDVNLAGQMATDGKAVSRSEERRVGKEC